ncbi:hypothetical protein R3P38DRAFT_3255114 [Favolaschia claudopus]|uniref:Uncharacterized protein n=1 Tax=Favolaschia claudopus TaxID=2862362 RepID=A0AAW0DK35_9AGAR
MADSSKVKKKEISDGSSHGVRTSRASAHSNFSSSASTARLDLLTDSSDERTDYVSQRNRRDGNKCQRLPRHRRLPPVIKTAPSALLQNVQFFRSQCPSPPGGTDSPPLRSTILGSFLGRGRPRNSSQSHIDVSNLNLHLAVPGRELSPSPPAQPNALTRNCGDVNTYPCSIKTLSLPRPPL